MKNNKPKNLNDNFGTISAPLLLPSFIEPNTVAVCMIVKNEAAKISKAIESVLPFADEIIINDTGSTDETMEKIREFYQSASTPRITLFSSKWEMSFSTARNQSLAKSKSAWNFWMDADDTIAPPEATKITKLKRAPLDRAFGFLVKNTNAYGMPNSEFMQIRMFPNHQMIGFRRRIHEQVLPSIAELGLHCVYTDGEIIHSGYENPEFSKQKQHRNLELMAMENDDKSDYMLLMAQGDAHFVLGEWEKGIEFFKMANNISNLDKINRDAYLILPSRIGAGFHGLKQFEQAATWYEIGFERFPDNVENCFCLGKCYQSLGQPEKAIQFYNKVFAIPRLVNSQCLRYDQTRLYAFHNATRLLMEMGRNRECLEILELMRNTYPDWELESNDIIQN